MAESIKRITDSRRSSPVHAARMVLIAALLAIGAGIGPAAAQDSRADAQREERERKAERMTPERPSFLNTALARLESGGVPLITRDGIYLKLGSLTTGSGFAYGTGYRTRRFLDDRGAIDVWGGASLKGYWATEGRVRAPLVPDGRLFLDGYGRRHEYTQEDFFGLGPDSARAEQTDYALRATTIGARVAGRVANRMAAGGGIEYLRADVGSGKDKAVRSIDQVFDEATAPGLGTRTSYLRTVVFVDVDRREPTNARRGGWYRAELGHYDDRDLGAYGFTRFDIDLRHFVSILSERRVFFGRVFVSTSSADSGQSVPFYLMPTLGGHDSLRGFRDYRFRGPHAVLLQGEYRFEVWSGFDAALFYDAGKVAERRRDLDLSGLETDYGIGFRFNTDNGIVLRVDSAFGSRDGKHLWIVFGGTF